MAEQESVQFEKMTLANVGDGQLEREFQEHLADASDIFDEYSRYAESTGKVRVKIVCEVELALDPETGLKSFGLTSGIKPPKRRKTMGAAFIRDGKVLVEPDRQQPIPFPTPVREAGHEKE